MNIEAKTKTKTKANRSSSKPVVVIAQLEPSENTLRIKWSVPQPERQYTNVPGFHKRFECMHCKTDVIKWITSLGKRLHSDEYEIKFDLCWAADGCDPWVIECVEFLLD